MNKKQLLRRWVADYAQTRRVLFNDLSRIYPSISTDEFNTLWDTGIKLNWIDHTNSFFEKSKWWTRDRLSMYHTLRSYIKER